MHFFWDTCTMLDHHRAVTNFETQYGYFELRARVPNDSGLHSAWWMIGNEARANQTAEIDIFETCGPDVKTDSSKVRVSVHPWKDKTLKEQSLNYYPACDVSSDFHVYGFEWLPSGMKFYFDGQLVKETSQSPNYKMTTLLGIYENNSGAFWAGAPDYNSTYPKRFEVDYFRAYKTDEMLARDAAEKTVTLVSKNVAPSAVAGAKQDWNRSSPPSNLIDNDAYSAMQSVDNPAFPQYIYLDWHDTQTFDTVAMKAAYGQGQAPTNWTIEVSQDGTTDWTEVAASGDVAWQSNDGHVEEHALTFPAAAGKAVRIKINSANLQWEHYAINEILVKNSAQSSGNANLAAESTPEWNSPNGGLLADGSLLNAAQSNNNPTFPSNVVLHWSAPVSFNKLQLHCWYAQKQAPGKVSFAVSADGATWRQIVAPTALTWQRADAEIENRIFDTERVENVRYLKMTVYEANLTWSHFAVNELAVYDVTS